MKDILGRNINIGDLVVAKGTGRNNNGLRVGLMRENSVRFENGNTASYTELFKIANPTQEELGIKEEILKYEKDREDARITAEKERKSKKAIPKKELEVGRMYVDDKGNKMYYLGKGTATEYKDKWDNRWKNVMSKGEGILVVGIDRFSEEYYGLKLCYDHIRRNKTIGRKTIPRFVKKLDERINIEGSVLEFIEDKEKPDDTYEYWRRDRRKFVIELEK